MEPYAFDLKNIFLGKDLPPMFFLEIVFRTTVMYLYTLLLIRLLGKRGVRQLTFFEFALIIALGSAVGDVMFYPDVPLLHGMVVITVVSVIQYIFAVITEKNSKIERVLESSPRRMICDGRLELEAMHRERLSQNELYSWLRDDDISHLGEVHRAYLEPSGSLSVIRFPRKKVRPGLLLIPREDPDFQCFEDTAPQTGTYACWECGNLSKKDKDAALDTCECGARSWTVAVEPE
ncbi:DUF421 domain-containing protein [Deinococcus roseus]|uniref:DUF421 domain-containing protein n=1 Tax=Deinococcus roseus TaxID=392414 RepID=A0ABQ2D223_9DEIO|nr:DUF421 domain-containing protein [Deinococcus roseus]GGJ40306.1 DUF421 domain-containing protein [Deinococcus roseus]